MSSRLDHVKDWNVLAANAKYQVRTMARKCGVSERQLRRYLQKKFGCRPKAWLDFTRAELAARHILNGDLVKTTSVDLQFKQRSHFSNFLKRMFGESASNLRAKGMKCPK